MPSEFDVIFEDFVAELDALSEMAVAPASSGVGLSPKARVAAGNGATLLLGALFEEFIRQQVRAAFREKAQRAKSFGEFPKKIAAVVWRRSLETLARTPFEEIESNSAIADQRLATIVGFCLKKDLASDVADVLSHNENNMKTEQLNALFNAIGISSMCAKACEIQQLIDYLGCDNAGKASKELEERINDFFRRRNEIAHAIQIGSSTGPASFSQDVELFRTFGDALTRTIAGSILAVAPNAA